MYDHEKVKGTSFTGTFVVVILVVVLVVVVVVVVTVDDCESGFMRLVKSGKKQGAECHRERHRVNKQFIGCIFSLLSTLLTHDRYRFPRVASRRVVSRRPMRIDENPSQGVNDVIILSKS
jgi:hypothetical protein